MKIWLKNRVFEFAFIEIKYLPERQTIQRVFLT